MYIYIYIISVLNQYLTGHDVWAQFTDEIKTIILEQRVITFFRCTKHLEFVNLHVQHRKDGTLPLEFTPTHLKM